jgi:protein phosphatase
VEALVVVCDGMGGSNAGEIASGMAVQVVVREVTAGAGNDTAQALLHAVQVANHEIWELARTRSEMSGMGTTCTVLALKGEQAILAHVGDSRAYLVRGHQVRQVTTDHSLVAQLVARQQLTPEEARRDPRRNVVTRSVGVGPEVDVDVVQLSEPLRDGDTFVLCTDGMHGLVSDGEIGDLVSEGPLAEACQGLVALANDRGGPDNITVVLVRCERTAAAGNPIGRWLRSLGGRSEG